MVYECVLHFPLSSIYGCHRSYTCKSFVVFCLLILVLSSPVTVGQFNCWTDSKSESCKWVYLLLQHKRYEWYQHPRLLCSSLWPISKYLQRWVPQSHVSQSNSHKLGFNHWAAQSWRASRCWGLQVQETVCVLVRFQLSKERPLRARSKSQQQCCALGFCLLSRAVGRLG